MTRHFIMLVVVVVIAAGSLRGVNAQRVRLPAAAQGSDGSAVASREGGKAVPAYTPAHTAWGDPDLQGVWSYNDDVSTPFERPSELGTKAEFGDEELAAVLAERARRDVARAPTIGGETGAGPTHWYEFWNRQSRRTSKVIDPPDGRVPPLTREAQRREAARAELRRGRGPSDSWEDRSLGDRCIVSRGGWPHVIVNAGSYGNIFRIVQAPGSVVLTHEMIHETRVIPVDGRPHISQAIRQYLGDSRGHFEGNTLVVEMTNFSSKTDFRGSHETLRLVERFTRVSANAINYTVTVDDPATFIKPWTIGVPLKSDAGQTEIFEYACHEGNYAMRNILSGARADEKAAAARKP
jgi:hypothetical protein